MALDDRDYMRKRTGFGRVGSGRPWWRRITLNAVIATVVAASTVVGAIAWLASDISYLGEFLPSREGTLVVNINTASADDLETLPGIGPALASLIIAGRPYADVNELERVKGIGPATVESLRPLLVVEGETRKR